MSTRATTTTLYNLTRRLINHRTPPASTILHRHFATSSRRTTTKKVDIAARARQVQTRRLWTYALTFSGVAGFVILVLNNFQDQLVFYVTPSEAMEKYKLNKDKNKFRLGGLVLEGSVNQSLTSAEMEFVVTDLLADILVRYQGSLPDLFREGHSVVVEGFVKPITDEIKTSTGSEKSKEATAKARSEDFYFSATEVLAKHDEKYMPKEVAAAIEKNKKQLEDEAEAASDAKKADAAAEAKTVEAAADSKKAAAA